MTGGTYTLLVALPEPATVEVGALGTHKFPAGRYAYTGSALGAAGFARVERHRDLATGERDVRHWHVDHLLGHTGSRLVEAITTTADAECRIASSLPEGPVSGFGASDCDCRSHLSHASDEATLRRVVAEAHDAVG